MTGLTIPVTVGKRYWLELSQSAPSGASTAFTTAPAAGSPLADGLWDSFFGSYFFYPAETVFRIDGTPTTTTRYSCQGYQPPMEAGPVVVHKKRALPLKAVLVDLATGQNVSGADISDPPIVNITYNPGSSGSVTDVTSDVLAVGLGTTGNQFVYTTEGTWQFNLKTDSFTAPGTYTITMVPGNAYVITPTCTTSFIIESK